MKYLFVLLLLVFSCSIFIQAQVVQEELAISLAGLFEIQDNSMFEIFEFNIWDCFVWTFSYTKIYELYFISIELETIFLCNYIDFINYQFNLFLFLKVGIGLNYDIGPLIIRFGIFLSPGFYILNEKYYSYMYNMLIKNERNDLYICFQPFISFGLKIQQNFALYIGFRQKYFIFFNSFFPNFQPYDIYIMFSYSL